MLPTGCSLISDPSALTSKVLGLQVYTTIFIAFFYVQRYSGLDHKSYGHSNREVILRTFFSVFFCLFLFVSLWFLCGGRGWPGTCGFENRVLLCSSHCLRIDYVDPPTSAGTKAMHHQVWLWGIILK